MQKDSAQEDGWQADDEQSRDCQNEDAQDGGWQEESAGVEREQKGEEKSHGEARKG